MTELRTLLMDVFSPPATSDLRPLVIGIQVEAWSAAAEAR